MKLSVQSTPSTPSCVLCKDPLLGRLSVRCGSCRTAIHRGCLLELPSVACPTLGCDEDLADEAQQVLGQPRRPRPARPTTGGRNYEKEAAELATMVVMFLAALPAFAAMVILEILGAPKEVGVGVFWLVFPAGILLVPQLVPMKTLEQEADRANRAFSGTSRYRSGRS